MEKNDQLLILDPLEDISVLKALASEPRLQMLYLIREKPLNVNEISDALQLPQSTVATHLSKLEDAGLLKVESAKAKKGSQKICSPAYKEVLIQFPENPEETEDNNLQVEMPIGLFTKFHVSPPCGLCSTEHILGFLDMQNSFLNPERMAAELLWFTTGYVEYQFPNNAYYESKKLKKVEFSCEISSETPGTNSNWPSDITVWINNVEIGSWTSPGDFGDRRGKYTPGYWKLEGSQYGLLKRWFVTDEGSFIDGEKISDITLEDLHIPDHHSVKVRIGVKEETEHPGGLNIFGKGFGNYAQDIILNLSF